MNTEKTQVTNALNFSMLFQSRNSFPELHKVRFYVADQNNTWQELTEVIPDHYRNAVYFFAGEKIITTTKWLDLIPVNVVSWETENLNFASVLLAELATSSELLLKEYNDRLVR